MGGERKDACPPLALTDGGWRRISGDSRLVAASTTDLGGNEVRDTTNLDIHYSQYDKNGDIELAFNEHEAPLREDVFLGRSILFLRCGKSSFAHAASLESWIIGRPIADSGNMWGWIRREISHIAEESGPQARARAATALPLRWIYRAFGKYERTESSLFTEDPSRIPFLSELADGLTGAEALSARDDNIFFEQCGAAFRGFRRSRRGPPCGGSGKYSRIAARRPGAACRRDRPTAPFRPSVRL